MYFHGAAELPGSRAPQMHYARLLGSGDAQTQLSYCTEKNLLRGGPWMFRSRLQHRRCLHFQGVCFISMKENVTIY